MPDRAIPQPAQLFYSYAHADAALCEMLDKHLSLLKREGLIASWYDRDISAGMERQREIDEHLNTASFILLLISPDFLASDYCYDHEVQRALALAQDPKTRVHVIPILLRPCDWRPAPFGLLQALPRNGHAITTWENLDEAFLEVGQSLREVVEKSYPASRSLLRHSVTTQNYKAMQALLDWMYQDLLTSVLQQVGPIELGLVEQPQAIQNATNLILRQTTQAEHILSPSTSILQIYREKANRELLILGPPGAGKSVLLYQLGRDLLATRQRGEPLPILFPLASWSEKKLPLVDWMEEHLASPMYHVPKKQALQWLQDEFILPLLDGLDEVEDGARSACITVINAYRKEYPLCPLVVCSRSAEYADASKQERLQLQSAIEVQLLSPEQVSAVLSQTDTPAALRHELEENLEFRELIRTPLWLNLSLLALKNVAPYTLPRQRSSLQKEVCALYVQHMIELKGNQKIHSFERTTRWLIWLAKQMQEQNQTLFAVEQVQPAALTEESLIWYRWIVVLILGLLLGLGVGLSVALSSGLNTGLLFGLGVGGPLGLGLGMVSNWFTRTRLGPANEIRLTNELTWSWKEIPGTLLSILMTGVSFGLLYWLFQGLLHGGAFGLASGLRAWQLVTLVFGPAMVLMEGVNAKYIDPQAGSSEKKRHHLRHRIILDVAQGLLSIFVGLSVGLSIGLLFGLFVGLDTGVKIGLLIGWYIGLPFGLFIGFFSVIQHLLLRLWFWRLQFFPLRARAFLDDSCERTLLKHMGGSYSFIHEFIFKYFADQPPASGSAWASEQEAYVSRSKKRKQIEKKTIERERQGRGF